MKKIILLFGIIYILFSCTGGDEAGDANSIYIYEIQKILGPKRTLRAGNVQNDLIFNKSFSYVIDTVEISINGPSAGFIAFAVECKTFETSTTFASNVTPHVNYIKFIDLKANWGDNKSKQMSLIDKNNMPPKFFTYSACNINLNNYPQFFVNNPYIPTYAILEVKPKVTNDIEIFKSNNLYEVGVIFLRDGKQYKVISKK